MHLGLIGGIGPSATVVYYQRLIAKFRTADVPLELTIVHADVAALIKNSLADRRAEQARIYARHIDQLKGAGADVAAITSLGGHFCFEETQNLSALPLLSAVAPLDQYFVANGIKKIGILGTETVMSTRLYGQLEQTVSVAPDSNPDCDLVALGQLYLDMAVAGSCSATSRQAFFEAGREMIEVQGADAVLLGGTDLGLAFDGFDPGFPVIDALDVHVDALFEFATGGRV